MAKISVIIPARNERFLQQTIDDLFTKATGEVEVVVSLDGYWPDPVLKDRPNQILIHNSISKGLRECVNTMARVATGKYIMKMDAHCMVAEGWDEGMQKEMDDTWIAIPSRYSLDAEKWERGYGPLEYLYLTYPYTPDSQYGEGLHGKKWIGESGTHTRHNPSQYYWMERARAEKKIDDIQAFQGSCWMMNRQRFLDIGGLDTRFGTFFQEPQEIAFKAWLTGGRIVINKHTWYAHWHKSEPTNYGFSNRRKHACFRYSTWYWMNDQWPGATKKIEEFIAFYWPIPGWPMDWREQKAKFEKEHPQDYSTPPEL